MGLAQALLGSPPILILDEPTSGLDPSQVAYFRELIKRLAPHHGILLSTHILSEVEASCSRAIFISNGRTISDESIASLRSRTTAGAVMVRVRSHDPSALASALLANGFPARVEGDTIHTTVAEERRGFLAELAGAPPLADCANYSRAATVLKMFFVI